MTGGHFYLLIILLYVICMLFICHLYANRMCTRMPFLCHSYVTRKHSYAIHMSFLCHSYANLMYSYVRHSYVTHMHSYIIRVSLACHSYVIRMSLVCICVSFVCCFIMNLSSGFTNVVFIILFQVMAVFHFCFIFDRKSCSRFSTFLPTNANCGFTLLDNIFLIPFLNYSKICSPFFPR